MNHYEKLLLALAPPVCKSATEVVYHTLQAPAAAAVKLEPGYFKLGLLRQLLGGDEANVRDARNGLYPISLAPWATSDPETTYLQLEVPSLQQLLPSKSPEQLEDEQKRNEYELEIRVAHAGEEGLLVFPIPYGILTTMGASLARTKKRLGGDEGYIEGIGIHGEQQFVSLKSLTNDDPELTFIQFNYMQVTIHT